MGNGGDDDIDTAIGRTAPNTLTVSVGSGAAEQDVAAFGEDGVTVFGLEGGGLLRADASGTIVSGETFETVSKNLSATGATLAYTAGELTSITYMNGIVKTLAYTDGDLTSVALSGATPDGIILTKALSYTDGNLTGVSYA